MYQQKAQHHATEMIELQGKLEQKQIHLEERKIDIARLEEIFRDKGIELSALKGELRQTQAHLDEKSNVVSALKEKVSHHEERESIARVIGKFAHAAKRKIQVDSYLNSHFLSILEQCDQLPEGMLEEAKVYEKSDKLNPPMERRVKAISMKETQKSVKKLNANAHAERLKKYL